MRTEEELRENLRRAIKAKSLVKTVTKNKKIRILAEDMVTNGLVTKGETKK